MSESPPWASVYGSEKLAAARTVATSLAAMEFDVRLVDVASGREIQDLGSLRRGGCCGGGSCPPTDGEVRSVTGEGPWAVVVPAGDQPVVAGVVSEILEEQIAFDAAIDGGEGGSKFKAMLPLVVAIVVVVAVIGWIRL